MKPRIHIDRLDLDLRGIDPVLAEAAVRLLGPALEARLSGVVLDQRGAGAHALAHHLADRVVSQLPSSSNSKDAGHAPRRID